MATLSPKPIYLALLDAREAHHADKNCPICAVADDSYRRTYSYYSFTCESCVMSIYDHDISALFCADKGKHLFFLIENSDQ